MKQTSGRKTLMVRLWPGRAKENAKLLAEMLPFAELRNGKFRQHPRCPVLALTATSKPPQKSEQCLASDSG